MTDRFPKNSRRWLQDSAGPMAKTLAKAQQLSRLEKSLLRQFHADFSQNIRLLNVRDNTIVLACPNDAWASRIRLNSRSILNAAQRFCQISAESVLVKVQRDLFESPQKQATKHLSETARNHLRSAIKSVDDPRIAASIQALLDNDKKSAD